MQQNDVESRSAFPGFEGSAHRISTGAGIAGSNGNLISGTIAVTVMIRTILHVAVNAFDMLAGVLLKLTVFFVAHCSDPFS